MMQIFCTPTAPEDLNESNKGELMSDKVFPGIQTTTPPSLHDPRNPIPASFIYEGLTKR